MTLVLFVHLGHENITEYYSTMQVFKSVENIEENIIILKSHTASCRSCWMNGFLKFIDLRTVSLFSATFTFCQLTTQQSNVHTANTAVVTSANVKLSTLKRHHLPYNFCINLYLQGYELNYLIWQNCHNYEKKWKYFSSWWFASPLKPHHNSQPGWIPAMNICLKF